MIVRTARIWKATVLLTLRKQKIQTTLELTVGYKESENKNLEIISQVMPVFRAVRVPLNPINATNTCLHAI